MRFKGSCPRVLSQFRVQCGLHWASLFRPVPPWSLKQEATSPAVPYACRRNYFYILNLEHLYQTMPFQSPHPDMDTVVLHVRSLPNCHDQQKRGPSGTYPLPPAQRRDSVPAGDRDSSQGGSFVGSTIQGQNSTTSSTLNSSHVADITQHMTSATSATLRQSIYTPTATPDTIICSTSAHRGTSQTDSTGGIECNPASGIASTPTPPSSFENQCTPIPNPEARAIITNPLWTQPT